MAKDYSNIEGLIGNVKESIRNAYDKGYKQGVNDGSLDVKMRVDGAYEKGLNDAWECFKKIVFEKDDGGLSFTEISNIFDGNCLSTEILQNYSASEAVKLVKAWEEKQKADSNKITRQSIIKSQLMDIVNGQKNPVTADEIAEVLEQLKGE